MFKVGDMVRCIRDTEIDIKYGEIHKVTRIVGTDSGAYLLFLQNRIKYCYYPRNFELYSPLTAKQEKDNLDLWELNKE